jgi:hypothetical protein
MTGTLNCSVDACVAFKPGIAAYQIAYPTPEARPPETIAYQTPLLSNETVAAIVTHKTPVIGTARRKLPAVATIGLLEFFPRKEYMPQATPADSINAELAGGGADKPGSNRVINPAKAAKSPTT